MADRRLDGAVITVNGSELSPPDQALLRSVRVQESVQLPDAFELRFDDASFRMLDAGTLPVGATVEIGMRADADPVVITSGEITAVGVEQSTRGRHELVVSGMDLSHRLGRATRRRTFLAMTDADIASQICSEHSLTLDADSTPTQHDYVLQANETDLDFLRARAARNGFDVWVSGTTLHFKQRPTSDAEPPTMQWGDNLLHFSVRYASAERADTVEVLGWQALDKTALTGRAERDGARTTASGASTADRGAQRAFGQLTRTATAVVVADAADGDAVARSLMARASGDTAVLRGEARGDPMIAAGARIRLQGVGEHLGGQYTVTSVTHLYASASPYVSRFVCGGVEPAELADLVGGHRVDPFAPRLPGLYAGEVTNADDPESLGRVKVRIPSLSTSDESTWARVATIGAGPSCGLQWVPLENDEVVLGFEQGDPSRPIVLGSVWNRTDAPPEPGSPTKLTTLVSRDGHAITLHNDPEAKIEITLADGSSSIVLESDRCTVTAKSKLSLSAQEIEISADSGLKLSGGTVEVSSSGPNKITGSPVQLN